MEPSLATMVVDSTGASDDSIKLVLVWSLGFAVEDVVTKPTGMDVATSSDSVELSIVVLDNVDVVTVLTIVSVVVISGSIEVVSALDIVVRNSLLELSV